uniref:Peptidase S1 domain-containing protein n=1 Tax=Equus asinus asinus TaxID=83772 RepID=A0A8C4LM12_EQUAS
MCLHPRAPNLLGLSIVSSSALSFSAWVGALCLSLGLRRALRSLSPICCSPTLPPTTGQGSCGHWLFPSPAPRYIVHLGEHNLQRRDGSEQTRTATESFPHPEFNYSLPNKDHRNDIMLVKMASPATITWAVRPLILSSRCVTPGTQCLISGWGTTSSPQCRGSRGEHG